MKTICEFATGLRDILLDAHESAETLRESVAAFRLADALPEQIEEFQLLFLRRAETDAEQFMAIAHVLDQLTELAVAIDGPSRNEQ